MLFDVVLNLCENHEILPSFLHPLPPGEGRCKGYLLGATDSRHSSLFPEGEGIPYLLLSAGAVGGNRKPL